MTAISAMKRQLHRAMNPVATFEAVAGGPPDPWQRDVLRTKSKRVALLNSRQAGKSTTVAAKALHRALFYPGSLILLLSPSQRQSGELFQNVKTGYTALGAPVPSTAESALQLHLANGSRIISLPGKEGTVRGYAGVNLLILDEASRIPDSLYFSVRPMLAVSGGTLMALTTPFGKRGWFYRQWMGEGRPTFQEKEVDVNDPRWWEWRQATQDGWARWKVPATDVPRFDRAFLEEEERDMGEWWFAQEYMCEFRDAMDQIFATDLVLGAFSSGVDPLFEEEVAAGDPVTRDVGVLEID